MWGRGADDTWTVCSLAGRGSETLRFDGETWTATPAAIGDVRGLSGGGGELLLVAAGGAILRRPL
jgi:hypothetical protein